ncbi:MAG: hypothetical protein QME75_05425 [Deltaproteobacteria bacterium]|nr:hypothetical protein [Deltaproteobacteria bacterium]
MMMEHNNKMYGSQYWLRIAVNEAREIFNQKVIEAVSLDVGEQIEWISPLAMAYTEYQDQQFVEKLRINLKIPLKDFWPKGGPVWDALARTSNPEGKVFLIEAKAHIPEINSSVSGASPRSLQRIAKSLNETKAFLDANPIVDWTRTFYQYTNRIAHLYFLRKLNNIYFINDTRMGGPSTIEEWKGALALLKTHLGITRTKLTPFMKDLFIDVDDLRQFLRKL